MGHEHNDCGCGHEHHHDHDCGCGHDHHHNNGCGCEHSHSSNKIIIARIVVAVLMTVAL